MAADEPVVLLVEGNKNSVPTENGIPIVDEALRAKVKKQLEYYFCRENLQNDSYLLSLMDANHNVKIATVAGFTRIKNLTDDLALIVEVLRSSDQVVVDETGTFVKPIPQKVQATRNTIIIREIPSKAEVEDLFDDPKCQKPVSIRVDDSFPDIWYVQFNTENEAVDTFFVIQQKTFKGKRISARIKSETVFKSYHTPAPNSNPINHSLPLPTLPYPPMMPYFMPPQFRPMNGYKKNYNRPYINQHHQQQYQPHGAHNNVNNNNIPPSTNAVGTNEEVVASNGGKPHQHQHSSQPQQQPTPILPNSGFTPNGNAGLQHPPQFQQGPNQHPHHNNQNRRNPNHTNHHARNSTSAQASASQDASNTTVPATAATTNSTNAGNAHPKKQEPRKRKDKNQGGQHEQSHNNRNNKKAESNNQPTLTADLFPPLPGSTNKKSDGENTPPLVTPPAKKYSSALQEPAKPKEVVLKKEKETKSESAEGAASNSTAPQQQQPPAAQNKTHPQQGKRNEKQGDGNKQQPQQQQRRRGNQQHSRGPAAKSSPATAADANTTTTTATEEPRDSDSISSNSSGNMSYAGILKAKAKLQQQQQADKAPKESVAAAGVEKSADATAPVSPAMETEAPTINSAMETAAAVVAAAEN